MFSSASFFLLNSKLKQLQGILFFCLLFEFKETYVWANFLKMQPHEENTLATKKRQFKKGKKEANFLKQCCNVQKQEELVSLFFLGLSQNLLGKKGNTLALLASGNVFFFFVHSFACFQMNAFFFFFCNIFSVKTINT